MTLSELSERLRVIVSEMGTITEQIGPGLIRLSYLRKEARMIIDEISASPKDEKKPEL